MKKIYYRSLIPFLLVCLAINAVAQVNLPYTLQYSSNDAAAWSDGIAEDGDGGTQNINGLTMQIFAADASSFNVFAGSTMTWHDNNYLGSGDADYTALTPGPDIDVTNNGIPAMVLKSSSTSVNFSLQSLRLYDWGGNPVMRMSSYDNGTLVGSILVTFDGSPTYHSKTITQADELTPSLFQNIDEVRFVPEGAPVFWLSFNNISLAAPAGSLPVNLISFDASLQDDASALLQWSTAQEFNSDHFDVEQSINGVDFTRAGTLRSAGNSDATTTYNYRISNLPAGNHYFRLKQVDIDGKFEFSKIIKLAIAGDQRVSLYPLPVKSSLRIYVRGEIIKDVRVFNTSGSLLKTWQPGIINPLLDLSRFPAGMYILAINTSSGALRKLVWKD